ncbi:MAG TPA: hypothetical protein VFQ55_01365 [Casimicrobiaceae bacterium]|nr:hypothetical protein [Casimicrobiaceae bacterium]
MAHAASPAFARPTGRFGIAALGTLDRGRDNNLSLLRFVAA